jgi:hypothetical protein
MTVKAGCGDRRGHSRRKTATSDKRRVTSRRVRARVLLIENPGLRTEDSGLTAVDDQSAALSLFVRAHARILVEARPSPILGVGDQPSAHGIEVDVFTLNTVGMVATEKTRTAKSAAHATKCEPDNPLGRITAYT